MILDLDKRAITYLPGVGPKKAEILQKEAHIVSYEDLLHYFPYKYVDRSRFYRVDEVTSDMPYIQLKGRIMNNWAKEKPSDWSGNLRMVRV